MRDFRSLILVGGLGLLVTACSAAAGRDHRSTLRVGWIGEPDTLNPFMAVESRSYECFRLMYNWLTGFGKNLEPVAGLAERWESSPDGLRWTYHLAKNATWHDGYPVTAEDVKFTYSYVLNNRMDLFMPYLQQVARIETPDLHTVVLHLQRPSVMMEQIFVPILPKHVWQKVAPSVALTWEDPRPVGSGPFRLVEWQKNRYLKFAANPHYFRGPPHIDEVVFVNFANTNTMMQALKRGEIQAVTSIPAHLFRLMSHQRGIKTVAKPSNGFSQITINVWNSPQSKGHPVLRDLRVRQAIAHAIDKKRLLALTKLGYGEPGSTIIPSMFSFWHWEPRPRERMEHDPDWSRRLLNEAGYRPGPDGIRRDRQNRPLHFRLYVRSGAGEDLAAGQLIAEQLREVGIAIDLRSVEAATQDSLIKDNGDFDLALYAWGGDADPTFLLSLFTTRQIKNWNDYYYSNPEYDRLFQEQLTQADRQRRRLILRRMQRIIYRDTPTIVLYYESTLQGFRTDRFAGWADDQAEGVLMALGGYTYTTIYPLAHRPGSPAGG